MPVASQAINALITSGQEYPPTLPEFYKLCSDFTHQLKMKDAAKMRELPAGQQTPEIAEYYKMCIKRILKVKNSETLYPWLSKVEDATEEQLNLIRDDLGKRGVKVHQCSEYA